MCQDDTLAVKCDFKIYSLALLFWKKKKKSFCNPNRFESNGVLSLMVKSVS